MSGAVLSDDGLYRYALTRDWGHGSRATFIMLNPSTADASVDDPTIRRCIGFAKTWGLAGLAVVNLYAYRATRPADLWKTSDPVGPDNDAFLLVALDEAAKAEAPIVAAWGANARPDRVAVVTRLPHANRLHALGLTKAGQPRHPLYMKSDSQPRPFGGVA